jgi:hypothetical protein
MKVAPSEVPGGSGSFALGPPLTQGGGVGALRESPDLTGGRRVGAPGPMDGGWGWDRHQPIPLSECVSFRRQGGGENVGRRE